MDPAPDTIGRLRSRSTDSAIRNLPAQVPPLALETIKETTRPTNMRTFGLHGYATSPYTLKECNNDSMGTGSWKIVGKSFSSRLATHIATALTPQRLHNEALADIDNKLATMSEELEVFKNTTINPVEALKLDVRLMELHTKTQMALAQKKSELQLECCEVTAELIHALLQTPLHSLHMEQCPLSMDAFGTLAFELPNKINGLESLQLVGIHLDVPSFKAICDGIIAQNDATKGIATLAFVACGIDDKYAKILKLLLSKSKHLVCLNLEKNNLGSTSSIRKIAMRSSSSSQNVLPPNRIRRSKSSVDGMKAKSAAADVPSTLIKSAPIPQRQSAEELSRAPATAFCHGINSIFKGAMRNQEARNNLKLIILSENRLMAEDRQVLVSTYKGRENTQVTFNVAKNGLNIENHPLLTYESPRGIASRCTTPRGSRNSGKFTFKVS